jgi:hypothetical protein
MEATPHRRFGRETLGAGFVEVVAALGTGVSVILPSLMVGIDQRIVTAQRASPLRQVPPRPPQSLNASTQARTSSRRTTFTAARCAFSSGYGDAVPVLW